jgi:hypothetical protein
MASLLPEIASAAPGDLYVTDQRNDKIFGFTPAGTFSTFAADSASVKIFKFSPAGTQTTFASGLSNPAGRAFDGRGDLFVATSAALRSE